VKEHPILFTGPMVRAILEGRKTQTRRPIKPQPPYEFRKLLGVTTAGFLWSNMAHANPYEPECLHEIKRPYAVGDRLWVRETWCQQADSLTERLIAGKAHYAADGYEVHDVDGLERSPWRPSIHMPRWASRITLEVTGIRPERIQSISEVGAKAEGVEKGMTAVEIIDRTAGLPRRASYRSGFELLWDSIYGSTAFAHGPLEWESNPWVWATTFKVVTP